MIRRKVNEMRGKFTVLTEIEVINRNLFMGPAYQQIETDLGLFSLTLPLFKMGCTMRLFIMVNTLVLKYDHLLTLEVTAL